MMCKLSAARRTPFTTFGAVVALVALVHPFGAVFAQSLPAGGVVTGGTASITSSEHGLLINQSSRNAIISWDSFSIGHGNAVHFENGTGATLNRVLQTPSGGGGGGGGYHPPLMVI